MPTVNEHFFDVEDDYLFAATDQAIADFERKNPSCRVLRMSKGDVTRPLAPAVVEAIHQAVDEMSQVGGCKGYSPSAGYDFLLRSIAEQYAALGVALSCKELFVSDGSKSDIGNIFDLFGQDNLVLVPDPGYPAYRDVSILTGNRVFPVKASAENGFVAEPPADVKADLIFLCSPNNPTGTAMDRSLMEKWVSYAKACGAIIFFDAVYERYISDPCIPHSIFQVEGAKECALEFRSYSKGAGFTGVRCSVVAIPQELTARRRAGAEVALNQLWARRNATRFNGVSYLVQRAAQAVHTPQGEAQTGEDIAFYQQNIRLLRQGLRNMGYSVFGGEHAPYLWLQCPEGFDSWAWFKYLLAEIAVAVVPGKGFGLYGEGYVRLSAFCSREDVEEVLARLQSISK